MADIIDINVLETVEDVTINVVDNVIQVNINKVTNVAGVPYVGATSDVNLGEFGLLAGNIEFDNTPTNIPTTAGSMYWNDTDGTTDLILKGGNVTLQVGQEQIIRVVNKTATNVNLLQSNYQAVRVTGAQGQRLKVDLALATSDLLSAETIGLVTETINNNLEGFITTSGLVRGINTTGSLQSETWIDGDVLYLSPTVAGNITKIKPVAPNHLVIIGYVIHAHINQGSIFVKVDNGYELDELHNVKITTPLNDQSLVYNSTLQVWENKTVSSIPTLQQVLDNNHELADGNNFQGTLAGDANTGSDVNAFGSDAGNLNTGSYANFLGASAGYENSGNNVNFQGTGSGDANTGSDVIGIGQSSASGNTANHVNVFGAGAGANNTFKNVNIFGFQALADADNQNVFSKWVSGVTKYLGRLSFNNITADRKWELPDASGTVALTSDIPSPITIDATPTDGSTNAVSSNGVFDALETKLTKWQSAVDGTSVINTLTITPTYSQLIPANTMVTGDVISVDYRATSPGAKTSITNHYLYVNTSNSLSGATQLALSATGATSRTCPLSRKLSVKVATTKVINATTSAQNDLALSAAMTTATIDWTVDQYLIFAIGHTVADQTMFGDFYLISK